MVAHRSITNSPTSTKICPTFDSLRETTLSPVTQWRGRYHCQCPQMVRTSIRHPISSAVLTNTPQKKKAKNSRFASLPLNPQLITPRILINQIRDVQTNRHLLGPSTGYPYLSLTPSFQAMTIITPVNTTFQPLVSNQCGWQPGPRNHPENGVLMKKTRLKKPHLSWHTRHSKDMAHFLISNGAGCGFRLKSENSAKMIGNFLPSNGSLRDPPLQRCLSIYLGRKKAYIYAYL